MSAAWAPVEPIGEALHFLRMTGSFYCRSEFSAPWGLAMPPAPGCLSFHVVLSGGCWLETEGSAPRRLEAGGLALVPHGEGHRLASAPGVPARRIDQMPFEKRSERYATLCHGGGGATTNLVCGDVRFDHPAAEHFVALLPRVIYVGASASPQADWVETTVRLLAAEAEELRLGGETVITRLADILIIQAIRSWVRHDPAAQTGWFGAMQDPQIGRALALVHRDPAHPWTLASLATAVAMSRSAFAARFTVLVGEPAMHYVARWRMHLALSWLREESASLAEVAGRLGYQSEAAFSRAFKRFVGVAPGAARRGEGAPAAGAGEASGRAAAAGGGARAQGSAGGGPKRGSAANASSVKLSRNAITSARSSGERSKRRTSASL